MIFEGTKNQFFFGLELTRAGDAVPMTETENKLAEEMPQEKDESEMMQEKDESEMPQEKDQSVYIVRDGDTLESILGVDRIVLQPGTALYRQK